MADCFFRIKITSKLAQTHQSIENSQAKWLKQKRSVEREMADHYFGIKIIQNLAQTHQSLENSLAMLLKKEVSRKSSSRLLFWNIYK